MTLRTAAGGTLPLILAAAFLALALSGCGRRGPLEAPDARATTPTGAKVAAAEPGPGRAASPAPTALATQPGADVADSAEDDETEQENLLQSVNPSPTPRGRRSRAYGVPKEPFVLDPLL